MVLFFIKFGLIPILSILAKKKVIQISAGPPFAALGIATPEKIWKLAWQINQQLGIHLSVAEAHTALEGDEAIYADKECEGRFDYFLVPMEDERGVPKIAKKFRYWFFIRARKEAQPKSDKIQSVLKGMENITLVADLSPFLEINDWII